MIIVSISIFIVGIMVILAVSLRLVRIITILIVTMIVSISCIRIRTVIIITWISDSYYEWQHCFCYSHSRSVTATMSSWGGMVSVCIWWLP